MPASRLRAPTHPDSTPPPINSPPITAVYSAALQTRGSRARAPLPNCLPPPLPSAQPQIGWATTCPSQTAACAPRCMRCLGKEVGCGGDKASCMGDWRLSRTAACTMSLDLRLGALQATALRCAALHGNAMFCCAMVPRQWWPSDRSCLTRLPFLPQTPPLPLLTTHPFHMHPPFSTSRRWCCGWLFCSPLRRPCISIQSVTLPVAMSMRAMQSVSHTFAHSCPSMTSSCVRGGGGRGLAAGGWLEPSNLEDSPVVGVGVRKQASTPQRSCSHAHLAPT